MTETIANPWAGYPIGGDWAWHLKNNGGRGGDDYKVAAGVVVHSPCAGMASHLADGLNTIVVELNDGTGRTIHMEENRSIIGSYPREVALGEPLAYTGLDRGGIVRWPHIHGQIGSTRYPFDQPSAGPSWVYTEPAPTPPAPNLRTTVAKGANLRSTPAIVASPSNIVSTLKGNIAYAIEKWQHGAPVGTVDTWFFVAGAWASATAFTSASTDGILDGNPIAPPVVVPPPVIAPPVVTPPVVVVPPVVVPTEPVAPTAPPVITAPVVTTPPKPVAPPATTPTKPSTPKVHPAAAPAFVAIVSAIVVAVGAIAAWIHTL